MQAARIAGALLSLAALPTMSAGAPAGPLPQRPNIVILLADDLGYGETGCQGNPEISTPHIDSLAKDGIRFTAGYVTASYCSPSRAALLTGRYQTRFGYEYNPVGAENEDPRVGLPANETTVAEHLRRAGYATALIGKWHLGGSPAQHPQRRGFDEFFGFLHEGHFYAPSPWRGLTTFLRRRALPDGGQGRWSNAAGAIIWSTHMGHDEPPYDANNPVLRGSQPVTEPLYLTDAFTREAIDFIERHKGQPFFLHLAYNAVHSPLQAADPWMERFAHVEDVHRRVFAAMLGNLDDSVGRVLDKLRREELDERTLVFFLSDNGGPTRELTSSNAPLRGGKGSVYEGGIRVPFLMRWNRVLPPGRAYDHPVISTDIFATAAAISGLKTSPNRPLDGVNLLPHLRGETDASPHETLFWRMGARTALRHGDWKIIRQRGETFELYNLRKDIGETTDLASTEPEKLIELTRLWERTNSEMAEPLWRRDR